jgi:mono/diheme cytochrome c family protein
MARKIIYVLMSMIVLISINGCYKDVEEVLYPATNATACDTANATYTKVLTIIQTNCYSCHSGTSPLGNVNLEGYANLKSYADNGKLIGAITWAPGFSQMPKGGNKLNDCDIANIQSWINQGALNN